MHGCPRPSATASRSPFEEPCPRRSAYPRAVLEPRDVLGFIETESAAAAATIASASLDAAVPSCPDWSFSDLILHLGRVQRFWAEVVRAGDVEPEFPARAPGPS